MNIENTLLEIVKIRALRRLKNGDLFTADFAAICKEEADHVHGPVLLLITRLAEEAGVEISVEVPK